MALVIVISWRALLVVLGRGRRPLLVVVVDATGPAISDALSVAVSGVVGVIVVGGAGFLLLPEFVQQPGPHLLLLQRGL